MYSPQRQFPGCSTVGIPSQMTYSEYRGGNSLTWGFITIFSYSNKNVSTENVTGAEVALIVHYTAPVCDKRAGGVGLEGDTMPTKFSQYVLNIWSNKLKS